MFHSSIASFAHLVVTKDGSLVFGLVELKLSQPLPGAVQGKEYNCRITTNHLTGVG